MSTSLCPDGVCHGEGSSGWCPLHPVRVPRHPHPSPSTSPQEMGSCLVAQGLAFLTLPLPEPCSAPGVGAGGTRVRPHAAPQVAGVAPASWEESGARGAWGAAGKGELARVCSSCHCLPRWPAGSPMRRRGPRHSASSLGSAETGLMGTPRGACATASQLHGRGWRGLGECEGQALQMQPVCLPLKLHRFPGWPREQPQQ